MKALKGSKDNGDRYWSEPGDFKGHKTVVIKQSYAKPNGDVTEQVVIAVGYRKAQALLACMPALQALVSEHEARYNAAQPVIPKGPTVIKLPFLKR